MHAFHDPVATQHAAQRDETDFADDIPPVPPPPPACPPSAPPSHTHQVESCFSAVERADADACARYTYIPRSALVAIVRGGTSAVDAMLDYKPARQLVGAHL
jgi:hypothetical protein